MHVLRSFDARRLAGFGPGDTMGGSPLPEGCEPFCRAPHCLGSPPPAPDAHPPLQDPSLNSVLASVRVLVLDEADNLLDMGFRPQIKKILSGLPPTTARQTYLFSATFPQDVQQLVNLALKPKHRWALWGCAARASARGS